MTLHLYLGVEGVLLRRTTREGHDQTGFELVPGALDFLQWASLEFRCYWLTRLDRSGGAEEITKAFRMALGISDLPGELELIFAMIQPRYWEYAKAEGIDMDSDFKWIDDDTDEESIAELERRSLIDRLLICREPNDLWKFACLLEPLSDLPEEW